ncbi:MAG: permease-like cell division protein FtsX [Bacillota bacterium]
MRSTSLAFGVRQSLRGLRQNALMSLASVLTVALSLLVAGLFGLIIINLGHLVTLAERQVEVTVFLDDSLPDQGVRAVEAQLKAMPGVTQVDFVSKAEALTRLKAVFADDKDLLAEVEQRNPLYRSFEVRTDQPGMIKPTADAAEKLSGVLKVNYKQDLVEKLFRVTRAIRVAGLAIMVILALAMVMIISNTIRITVFARRHEIGIMKLVGATDGFIRWPFVCEGMALGLAGAVFAGGALWGGYSWVWGLVQRGLPFIPLLPKQPLLFGLTALIGGAGVIVGAFGSALSLRRFLQV